MLLIIGVNVINIYLKDFIMNANRKYILFIYLLLFFNLTFAADTVYVHDTLHVTHYNIDTIYTQAFDSSQIYGLWEEINTKGQVSITPTDNSYKGQAKWRYSHPSQSEEGYITVIGDDYIDIVYAWAETPWDIGHFRKGITWFAKMDGDTLRVFEVGQRIWKNNYVVKLFRKY
jgi:hypothetical protein